LNEHCVGTEQAREHKEQTSCGQYTGRQ